MRVLTVQLMFKLPLAMTVSAWRTVSTAPAVPAALKAVLPATLRPKSNTKTAPPCSPRSSATATGRKRSTVRVGGT